ncbi:hypothetical protein BDP27DRAFT_1378973 [Rhodocollybia butyracea]|uniref:non-specific serine/threonine protein kinase n=1 Tax=Rhodocollybia butyracea TaxID=206335 RepID=A0A9P5QC73_9AGAR|nr:hypothetical protein BDP27DRAFT_1378973 [Rhodocollybia butyracea]
MVLTNSFLPLFFLSIALFCLADINDNFELSRHSNPIQRRPLADSAGTSNNEEKNPNDPLRDSELLDVVLVASVDGKFHALNRTSGHLLWSMPSFAPEQSTGPSFVYDNLTGRYPSTLAPLVRTVHNSKKEIDDDDTAPDDEVYIIEPQSGAIYILPSNPSPTQNHPLRRFPFTMPELVNLSPFSFADPDGHSKLFVGRKETSMLIVELETGKIKASVGGECPWDPFDDFKDGEESNDHELDLDELESEEDDKPSRTKVKPTEVFIGRTDYHISIHTRTSRIQAPPVQTLSFSTYGPNNQDTLLQSSYSRTKDDSYVQSLPTGELMAFRAHNALGKSNEPLLWVREFSNPIVATFDVLKRPTLSPQSSHPPGFHTFVLLQPQPSLTDFHPSLSHVNSPGSKPLLPNSDSAYIGLVEETGSLFAMSPNRFPFVAFGGRNGGVRGTGTGTRKMIDFPSGTAGVDVDVDFGIGVPDVDEDLPVKLDEVTERRKIREEQEKKKKELVQQTKSQDLDTCDPSSSSSIFDLRCLVGVHKLEEDATGGKLGLLDGPPSTSIESPSSSASAGENSSDARLSVGSDAQDDVSAEADDHFAAQPASSFNWKWEILVVVLVGLVGVTGVTVGRYTPSSSSSVQSPKFDNPVASASGDDTIASSNSSSVVDASGVDLEIPPDVSLPENVATPTLNSFNGDIPASSAFVPATPFSNQLGVEDSEGEGDEAEGAENDATESGGRKKKMRRKRGKKKKGGAALGSSNAVEGGLDITPEHGPALPNPAIPPPMTTSLPAPSVVMIPTAPMPLAPAPVQEPTFPSSTLVVSETILGFGSHGTVVFRGSLQGRSVAVKRLLRDFVTLASREVNILQESDDHPNVIRYYYQETHANFLYIALELCPGSLADVFESSGDLNLAYTGLDVEEEARNKEDWQEIRASIIGDPKKALKQITSGLRHLHALKLVHRDIKPQNILVATGPGRNLASSSSASLEKKGGARAVSYRMLISDFGLCKKLDLDQTSFLPTAHGAMGAGTFGWRAPEILRGEVRLDNSEDMSSSKGSAGTANGQSSSISSNSSTTSSGKDKPTRLTKSVDIFALGCLFYYMLTAGGHPFGDRFEREVNIIKGTKDLTGLEERYGEEGVDAADLIERMLNADSSQRPDTSLCLLHPFFWDSGRRLNFLQDASDRFEIMCREPKDPLLLQLERNASAIVGSDWHSRVDRVFIDNLGKFRKYDGKSVQDLLRALRNKKHHYQDLPDNVKRHLGAMPEGYLSYFTRRYPQLFLHVHWVISDSQLRFEPMFRTYFELTE